MEREIVGENFKKIEMWKRNGKKIFWEKRTCKKQLKKKNCFFKNATTCSFFFFFFC